MLVTTIYPFAGIDRGPLLQTLFASLILIHKKHMCCSTMLSKDLFFCLTDTKTISCDYSTALLLADDHYKIKQINCVLFGKSSKIVTEVV